MSKAFLIWLAAMVVFIAAARVVVTVWPESVCYTCARY